jgi:hypothetical protein
MTYRVLITRTLDVPKNIFHGTAQSEEDAKNIAQAKLVELDGDVAVISVLNHGLTKVLHTFERARKQG